MIIALDFDGTYTEDPEFWNLVIAAAACRSHEVIVATMRHDHEMEGERQKLERAGVSRVICTGRKAKMRFLEERGIRPDVWIDDQPMFLFQGG